MPGLRPVTFSVKTPVVWAGSSHSATPVPPCIGMLLLAVGAIRMPRLLMGEPPSLMTLPPRVAIAAVLAGAAGLALMAVAVGPVTSGAPRVVKVYWSAGEMV